MRNGDALTSDPRIHYRRTIRLSGWDYSADGAYFVTVCTERRAHLFGDIVEAHMRLNAVGAVVADTWRWLSRTTHTSPWTNGVSCQIICTDCWSCQVGAVREPPLRDFP